MAELILLNRIRVDIGNVSGSISKLMQYSSMSGFNDAGEEQIKPRLVGTWTINDWYTQEQLTAAQAAFDGLTVVGDPNYVINFDDLAVQCLDDTKPNYNPAVAVILQSKGLGVTMDSPVVDGQTGRWFLSKTQAATITSNNLFNKKNTVTDSNGIVTLDTSATYTFTKFHEFRYFTGLTALGGRVHTGDQFYVCYSLQYFTIPQTIVQLFSFSRSKFGNCVIYLKEISISSISVGKGECFARTDAGGNSDKFITSAYKDKYKDYGVLQSYPYKDSRFKTWYQYACPQISYNGTDVTITVERTSTIYYTTDGSTPTEQSTEYTQPFAWDGQGVIKAIAIDFSGNSHADDRIAYADDFYAATVELPVISYSTTTKQITLSSNTSNTTIHYTLDGSYPTPDSPIYSGPIDATELGDIIKVRCFATAQGKNDSEVVGKICVMDDSLWGTDGDTSFFAVQCMDSTKPNYNPAVCIILDNNNKLTDKCYGGGGYISKTDAAKITTDLSNIFSDIQSSITDRNNIVTYNNQQYNLTSLNELKYFTGITSFAYIGRRCKDLESIEFPNSVISLGTTDSTKGVLSENQTRAIKHIVFPANLTTIKNFVLTNSSYINNIPLEIPGTVTTIGQGSFYYSTGGIPNGIHINSSTPPIIDSNVFGGGKIPKIYVGDGSSASHDNTILQKYLADEDWAIYSNRLATWDSYLHVETE